MADFLKGIGQGVEAHAEKVAAEVHSVDHLVLVRRTKLKKIGVPCKLVGVLFLNVFDGGEARLLPVTNL